MSAVPSLTRRALFAGVLAAQAKASRKPSRDRRMPDTAQQASATSDAAASAGTACENE